MAKKTKSKTSIMNLPNKITIARIILSLIIVVILVLPFNMLGVNIPKIFINEKLVVDVKYLVVGVLFIIASLTDYLDGYIARSRNLVTDFGKMMDAIASKIQCKDVQNQNANLDEQSFGGRVGEMASVVCKDRASACDNII